MADANALVEAMKKAALDAQEAAKPVNVYFGEVVSGSPLKINVEQKMLLGAAQLVLAERVTEHRAVMEKDAEKESVVICSALETGDKVILARQQEGQKFIVLDRIGG